MHLVKINATPKGLKEKQTSQRDEDEGGRKLNTEHFVAYAHSNFNSNIFICIHRINQTMRIQ